MISIPEIVERKLADSIKRVRKIYLLRGLAATLAALLAAALVVMAIDAKFTLFSDAARWALSLLLYGSVAAVAFFVLARPLLRRLDYRRMAQELDARHPENEECLVTLVELVADAKTRGAGAYSEALFAALVKKAEYAAWKIDPDREFTSRTIVRRLKWLVGVLAVLALSFVTLPHLAGRLFIRAVAPWADVGNLYANDIEVTPGDLTVLAGTVIRIEAKVDPSLGAEPQIRISRKTALGWGAEFAEPMSAGVYETTADITESLWRYRVSAGPAVSRYFTVKVCEMPRLDAFVARIVYPAYTRLGENTVSNDEISTITAVEGTRVAFELKPSAPGTKVAFLVDNREEFEHTMVSNRTATWSLDLENAEGFKAPRRWGELRSVRDAAPSVVVEQPQTKTLKLPPHAKFPFEISASDDIGVARAVLRVSVDNGEWSDRRDLASFALTGSSLWKGSDELDLSTLDLLGRRQVAFDVVVTDGYPAELGGPHAATSTPVVVQLEVQAKNFELQTLAEQAKEADRMLDEARRRLNDARGHAEDAKNRLARNEKPSEKIEREIEKAVHEATEARKRIAELEEKFAADERFKPIAERIERIREEKLEPALAKLEAAQFEEREARRTDLEAAIPELEQAIRELQKTDQPLRERVAELEKLERAKDLAARQEALAETATEIMKERPVDKQKLEAWKRMEAAAARQANDLRWQTGDPEFDEARRKMEKAAQLMEDFKRELENESDRNRSEEQRAERAEQLKREAAERRLNELRDAERTAKAAEDHLKRAQNEPNNAEHHVRQAEDAQRRLADMLERAEASEPVKELQREAAEETRNAKAAEHPKDEAVERQSAARRAIEAERAALEKELKGEDKKTPAETADPEKLKSAAEAAAKAADEMAKQDADGFREATKDAERAAEEMTKAEAPESLRTAQEKTLEAAQEIVRQLAETEEAKKDVAAAEEKWRAAHQAQRQADEAGKKADEAQAEAVKAEESAQAAQKQASERERDAKAAAERAAKSRTAEDFAKAEEARKAADSAQEQANAEQRQAAEKENAAAREEAAARSAQEQANAARKDAAEATLEAAIRGGDEASKQAAEDALAAEKESAEATERAQAARDEAQREAEAAQREAEEAQKDAREAQARAQAAQAEEKSAAAEGKDDAEARRRTDTAQREAAAAQQRASEAQARALEAEREALEHPHDAAALNDPVVKPDGRSERVAEAMEKAAKAERKIAEAMQKGDAESVAEAAAAAEDLEEMAESLEADREEALLSAAEQELAAGFDAVEEHQEAAAEAMREGDFNRAANEARAAEEGMKRTSESLEQLKSNPGFPAEATEAIKDALTEQNRAQQSEKNAREHAENAVRDSNNGWHKAAAKSNQDQAAEHVKGARESFDRAREAAATARERAAAEKAESGKQSSKPSAKNASEPSDGPHPDTKAAEAAEAMNEAIRNKMDQLGMKGDQSGKGERQGKGSQKPQKPQPPSDEESESGTRQEGSASGKVRQAMSDKISQMANELRRGVIDEKPAFGKSGWFKIQGAAKEGLGERELKDIPAEYRDLVRTYFLKLAEESEKK